MKKKVFIGLFILIALTSTFIICSNFEISSVKHKDKLENQNLIKSQSEKKAEIDPAKKYPGNCKSCHISEYPTKKDPGLVKCPRSEMISINHTAKEGPEIVILDELTNRYNPVVFSHKLHAEMSEMTGGCGSCHHYNTTGPVLACNTCHEVNRLREDISKPDLSAAYHRQCVNCHRQWMRETECNSCHEPKSENYQDLVNKLVNQTKGRYHPEVEVPSKFIFETNYEKGKLVTFYHKEHTDLYKAPCIDCHKEENCIKCHDVKIKNDGHLDGSHQKIHKTFEDHHKPCSNCHKQDKCDKCHSEKELKAFDHSATGWPLGKFHEKLTCNKCHGNATPIKKLNNKCVSCHKDFKPNQFKHKNAGLILSENHKDLDCENCHLENKFNKPPVCTNCHDDKIYPKALPGKRIKI